VFDGRVTFGNGRVARVSASSAVRAERVCRVCAPDRQKTQRFPTIPSARIRTADKTLSRLVLCAALPLYYHLPTLSRVFFPPVAVAAARDHHSVLANFLACDTVDTFLFDRLQRV
jgi:hypothetical protein